MDSSTIVQKMHELNVPEINTFTLGFNEPTDEFSDASLIAKHFNTNHRTHSLSLDPLADLKKTIWHAEEPKINLLQGYNMSDFVSKHVKVVLGGLGGDEIFAGYDIHKFIYPSNQFVVEEDNDSSGFGVGQEYVGFYHVHKNEEDEAIYMAGEYHSEEE